MSGIVTVVNGGTVQVGASPDALRIAGNLAMTGGTIHFEIDPDGRGGFEESTLLLDAGSKLLIAGSHLLFNFANGADVQAFESTGLFRLATFVLDASGGPFVIGDVFQNDRLSLEVAGAPANEVAFDAVTGSLSVASVPEPGALGLMMIGLACVKPVARRRRQTTGGGEGAAARIDGAGGRPVGTSAVSPVSPDHWRGVAAGGHQLPGGECKRAANPKLCRSRA